MKEKVYLFVTQVPLESMNSLGFTLEGGVKLLFFLPNLLNFTLQKLGSVMNYKIFDEFLCFLFKMKEDKVKTGNKKEEEASRI